MRNVIYVLHALKMCSSWSVTPKNQGYEVSGTVDCKGSTEIELRDLELIKRVDPLRITTITLRILGGGNTTTATLAVFVLRKSEPVVLEEQDVVQIRRKRKFWGFGGIGS